MVVSTIERDEADIVIVVAELLRLAFSGLVHRIELGRVRENLVTPAQQHIGIIAFGNMMSFVDAGLDFGEGERACAFRACLIGDHQRQRADRARDGGHGERAAQKTAARETAVDDVAHGWIVGPDFGRRLLRLRAAR
jgi:hypothetical protein